MLTNSVMFIISKRDTTRPLGIQFTLFINSVRNTKYYKQCSWIQLKRINNKLGRSMFLQPLPRSLMVGSQSGCRPLCNIGILYFITLLGILMLTYQRAYLNAKFHEVTLMVKLLFCVTWHMPQNRVSDTKTHVTLEYHKKM